MSVISVDFGPMINSVELDRRIIRFLSRWLPTYIRMACERDGKAGSWAAKPRVYATLYDEDDEDFFSDKRLPCVFVTAGEATRWGRDGDGHMYATYLTRITTVSRGRNKNEARLQAALHCAAVTELLIGRAWIEGIANGVHVVSERPRPIIDPSNRSRALAGGFGEYEIFVPNLRTIAAGPMSPDPPEPDDTFEQLPTVSDVDIELLVEPSISPED